MCVCLCKCVFVGVEPESESHLCISGDSVTEQPDLNYPVNEFSLAWSHDPGSFGVLTSEFVAR